MTTRGNLTQKEVLAKFPQELKDREVVKPSCELATYEHIVQSSVLCLLSSRLGNMQAGHILNALYGAFQAGRLIGRNDARQEVES